MTVNESTSVPIQASTESGTLTRRLPYVVCVVLACVLMFGNYIFVIVLGFVPGINELAGRSLAFGTFWNVLNCLVTLATALVLVKLAVKYVLGGRLRDIGWVWTKDSWWLFLVGWAASALTLVATLTLVPLTGLTHHTPIPPEEWHKLTAGVVVSSIIMRTFQALPLQGIPEELVWRGWLMHCLIERPRLGLVVSAMVFGALHIISAGGQQNALERFIYCIQAAAFAFCAGALASRLRSLWPAIGVHGGMHLTNLVLNFTPLNASGPAIWLSESVLYVAIGLVALTGWNGDRVQLVR